MANEGLTSKRMFYPLWEQGLFGNKPRTWSVEEFKQSGFTGVVAIRYRGGGGGGPFITDLHPEQVAGEVAKLTMSRFNPSDLQIAEQLGPPEENYVINGEYGWAVDDWWLTFSLENALMRPALRRSGKRARGVAAKAILRSRLWPADYDDLMAVVDLYDDHVVEFSGFDQCVGTIPGRRMIVWEVRKY